MNGALAGSVASSYGFHMSAYGVGINTYHISSNGSSFGVASGGTMAVLDLLLAAEARSSNGVLYDLN
ncbi:MAG TPA: hypothetical protein VK210_17005 [Terriglobia bacterium]|nr:hypothetical protein [Terriglobia bacterium]